MNVVLLIRYLWLSIYIECLQMKEISALNNVAKVTFVDAIDVRRFRLLIHHIGYL